MNLLIDSFLRAVGYCLRPRVMLLSLLPVAITGALSLALGHFFWDDTVRSVRMALTGWAMFDAFFGWLASLGWQRAGDLVTPMVVIALAGPLMVLLSLLLVALFMTPALVTMVCARRFPLLERKHGAALWQSVSWSVGATFVALVALVVSVPFWLVPPLVLILPPLIWGWLNYRVMSFDALAEHASREERATLMRRHRLPLLGIGVVCGYVGVAPSLIWGFGAMTVFFAPLLLLASVWLYTLVFAFSSLWFTHYCLKALQTLRGEREVPAMVLPGADYPGSADSAVRTVSGLPEAPIWPRR